MMSDREKKVFAIVLVFGFIAGYFSLAWAGVIPEQYNVIEHYFGTGDGGDTTGRSQQIYEPSLTLFYGIPDYVNLTEHNDTYQESITVTVKEGYANNFKIHLDVRVSGADVRLHMLDASGNQHDLHWMFSEDGHTAHYVYPYYDLTLYESTSIGMTVTKTDTNVYGKVYVTCLSNGNVEQNSITFPVYN